MSSSSESGDFCGDSNPVDVDPGQAAVDSMSGPAAVHGSNTSIPLRMRNLSSANLPGSGNHVFFRIDDDAGFGLDPSDRRRSSTTDLIGTQYSRSIQLSSIYALVLISIGVVLPMTEAIKESWMSSHVVASFMVYLFSVSIVYIVYVIFYHTLWPKRIKPHLKKKKPDSTEYSTSMNTLESNGVPDSNRSSSGNGDAVQLRHRSLNMRSQSSASLPADDSGVTSLGDDDENGRGGQPFSISPSGLDQQRQFGTMPPRSFSVVSLTGHGSNGGNVTDDVIDYITLKSTTASMAHGGSFYLRIGCLLFSVANLVYIAVTIQRINMLENEPGCSFNLLQYDNYFHIAFVIAQTFYLFKSFTPSVRKHRPVMRFGLMHVLATNLCVWWRVLVSEVVEGIYHANSDHESHAAAANSSENATQKCGMGLDSLTAPYLYPFVLEYSLIAAAAMMMGFYQIDIHITKDVLDKVRKAIRRARNSHGDGDDHGGHSSPNKAGGHHGNGFSKAHTGMFLGFIVLAGTLVSIVLFYVMIDDHQEFIAELSYQITHLGLLLLLQIAVIAGMVFLYDLGYDLSRDNSIDHTLLLVSLVGTLIFEFFSVLANIVTIMNETSDTNTIFELLNALLVILQSITQSIFIIDGMQRFSKNAKQMLEKPGRGVITFMIVTNVAVWLFKTFQQTDIHTIDEVAFYGAVGFSIILKAFNPLKLYYRFHSSICLADMWESAYKPEDDMFETQLL